MSKESYRAIGLMSGTSADGVDAALIETDGHEIISSGPYHFVPYQPDERAAILELMQMVKETEDHRDRQRLGSQIDGFITERHFEAILGLLDKAGLYSSDIDVIGFHGQTLFHEPEAGFTLQVGDPRQLATMLMCRIVHDFRSADVRAGGQGAPLVPIYHQALVRAAQKNGGLDGASDLEFPVAVVNIGGVANVTYIDEGEGLIAFDTGPGNVLIDEWVGVKCGQRFDDKGALAASGQIDEPVLTGLLTAPYFAQKPPKSLDRYAFSFDSVIDLSIEDGAATLTEFTARTIANAAALLPKAPRAYVIVGGGVHNDHLMSRLAALLEAPLYSGSDVGWQPGYVEAEAFGYLAVRHLLELPLTFPLTTGVKAPQRGGRLMKP